MGLLDEGLGFNSNTVGTKLSWTTVLPFVNDSKSVYFNHLRRKQMI